MTGRSHRAYGEEFPFTDSEYADDTAALFDSRESLQTNAPLLLKHFSRFGMEVHKGNLPAEKKIENGDTLLLQNPANVCKSKDF